MSLADWIGRRIASVAGSFDCLGPLGCARLLAENYLLRRRAKIQISLRGVQHTVSLRGRTSDIQTFFQIFALQEYGFDHFAQSNAVQAAYDDALASGLRPVIIDCGANIGLSAIWFALRFPRARIIAVEPSASNMKLLAENTAPYGQIEGRNAAISDRNAFAKVSNPEAEPWAFKVTELNQADDDAACSVVPTLSIRQLVEEAPDGRVILVKIDVEGAEDAVFRSDVSWLGNVPLLVIETHDALQPFRGLSRNLFRALADLPFEICFAGENAFVFIDPVAPPRTPGAPEPTIAVPDGWSEFLARSEAGTRRAISAASQIRKQQSSIPA